MTLEREQLDRAWDELVAAGEASAVARVSRSAWFCPCGATNWDMPERCRDCGAGREVP